MELEKLQKYAKKASKKEIIVLDGLKRYFKGQCSLGYVSEQAKIPLRALMDFMQMLPVPYNWDSADAEDGLRKISEIRSMLKVAS